MKTVVYCWELGGGNGHVVRFLPLADLFLKDGWRVVFIVKDVSRLATFMEAKPANVVVLQAPIKTSPKRNHDREPPTIGHMLLNVGYRDEGELCALVQAWQNIFELVRPDLLVADHSPTALIASRGRQFPRAVLGTGFHVPANESPIGLLAPWRSLSPEQRAADEQTLLARVNAVLHRLQAPRLDHLAGIWSETSVTFLATYAELDHCRNRAETQYTGVWSAHSQNYLRPTWPAAPGIRVFLYLKQMRVLPKILAELSRLQASAIAVLDRVEIEACRGSTGDNTLLLHEPVDIPYVADSCQLAITNGGHSTVAEMLLRGVPQFVVPLQCEQSVTALRIKEINAGKCGVPQNEPALLSELRATVLGISQFSGARDFQKRYRHSLSGDSLQLVYDRLTELVSF